MGLLHLDSSGPNHADSSIHFGYANRGIPCAARGMNHAPKGVLRLPPMAMDSSVWNQLVEAGRVWVFDRESASFCCFKTSYILRIFAQRDGELYRRKRGN